MPLKKLSKQLPPDKVKLLVNALFYSRINYCLPVYGNVFDLDKYKDSKSRYVNFTIRDNNMLQVLQNKLNRVLTRCPRRTPTAELIKKAQCLSVQQLIAFQTLITMFKIIHTSKPFYLINKIRFKVNEHNLRNKQNIIDIPKYRLSQSKEGFIYRGSILFNQLDEEVRNIENLRTFKYEVRRWVQDNICVKPRRR